MFTILLVALTAAGIAASFLPLWRTPLWWVRALEFPRFQIVTILGLTLLADLWRGGPVGYVLALPVVAAMALQAAHIWQYTPLSAKEMRQSRHYRPEGDMVCLALNVLMENRDHDAVRAEIARVDPDVLLLMEIDKVWDAALAPALEGYSTVLREPLEQYYGLIFATRLKVREAKVVYLSVEDTPSVLAEMEAPDGTVFRFVGLHPKPPVPGEDTVGRDAEVAYAARFARETGMPVIAMGDFNTPAWSQISQRFKVVGGYLDPRVGRGPLSSFDANRWWLRMPIDQFFATEEVVLVDFRRGNYVGSDHFPMLACVRFDAEEAARLNRRAAALPDAEEERILRSVEWQGARLKKLSRPPGPG